MEKNSFMNTFPVEQFRRMVMHIDRFDTDVVEDETVKNAVDKAEKLYKGYLEGFIKLLSPVAPHICEELWQELGHEGTIAYEKWPEYDEAKCADDEVTYAVSVNGKLRDKILVSQSLDAKEVEKIALAQEKIKAYTEGHTIVKIIVVPKKIVNIVIK